jgi:uncharacterized protein (DUF1778 family)
MLRQRGPGRARSSPDVHALLKRAAEIEGRSLSDFVVTAARQAAEKTIVQADTTSSPYRTKTGCDLRKR